MTVKNYFAQKHILKLKKRFNKLLTIIIPRHIHRVHEIKSKIEKLNLKVSLHSSNLKNLEIKLIFI